VYKCYEEYLFDDIDSAEAFAKMLFNNNYKIEKADKKYKIVECSRYILSDGDKLAIGDTVYHTILGKLKVLGIKYTGNHFLFDSIDLEVSKFGKTFNTGNIFFDNTTLTLVDLYKKRINLMTTLEKLPYYVINEYWSSPVIHRLVVIIIVILGLISATIISIGILSLYSAVNMINN